MIKGVKVARNAPETLVHLFLHYPLAKAVWFSSTQGLHVDAIQADSIKDIINNFLNLPVAFVCQLEHEDDFILFMALAMNFIWRKHNQTVHDGIIPSLPEIQKHNLAIHDGIFSSMPEIQRDNFLVFQVHKAIRELRSNSQLPSRGTHQWAKNHSIKINCDAAVSKNHSMLASVARDQRGSMAFEFAKKNQTPQPRPS